MRQQVNARKQFVVAAFAVLATATFSNASLWSVPAGSAPMFNYSNGQNATNKFGDGTLNGTGSGFDFIPVNFLASANGTNTPVTSTDTASVQINSTVGRLLSVTSTFIGDYSILGGGSVSAAGTLVATNLDTSATVSAPLVVSGVPVTTAGSAQGGVYGSVTLNLPNGGWSNFKLDFTTTLTATATSNGVALIQNKDSELIIRNKVIPEPTSMLAAGLVGALVRRSRR